MEFTVIHSKLLQWSPEQLVFSISNVSHELLIKYTRDPDLVHTQQPISVKHSTIGEAIH